MTEPFTRQLDLALWQRAIRSSDPAGEAALNGLLYASGALVTSAVLLVTSEPAVLGMALAPLPWVILAVGAWWWIYPALRGEVAAGLIDRERNERARAAAADLLLEEIGTPDQRALAAAYLTGLEGEERDRAVRRLLGEEEPLRS